MENKESYSPIRKDNSAYMPILPNTATSAGYVGLGYPKLAVTHSSLTCRKIISLLPKPQAVPLCRFSWARGEGRNERFHLSSVVPSSIPQ